MIHTGYESWLWWAMLITGCAGALLSITTGLFDRRKTIWPTARQRQALHLLSYGFMTLSILAFILRGLTGPA